MEPWEIALRVTTAILGFVLLIWGCVAAVRSARRGGRGVRAAGMALMLFGWGRMRDPRNDTVAEAKDGRIRKGTESGDPE